jgi:hypothetical protein
VIGKSEDQLTEDWLARRAAMMAEKAPKLPTVLLEIETCVGLLMRMAADVEAGRMALSEFSTEGPGEASVFTPLLMARYGR